MIDKSTVRSQLLGMGERIRAMRIHRGMTQRELALAIGMTEGGFRQVELGKRNMGMAYLSLLCSTLGSSADYILYDGGIRPDAGAQNQ